MRDRALGLHEHKESQQAIKVDVVDRHVARVAHPLGALLLLRLAHERNLGARVAPQLCRQFVAGRVREVRDLALAGCARRTYAEYKRDSLASEHCTRTCARTCVARDVCTINNNIPQTRRHLVVWNVHQLGVRRQSIRWPLIREICRWCPGCGSHSKSIITSTPQQRALDPRPVPRDEHDSQHRGSCGTEERDPRTHAWSTSTSIVRLLIHRAPAARTREPAKRIECVQCVR